jgi:hypothetical protein
MYTHPDVVSFLASILDEVFVGRNACSFQSLRTNVFLLPAVSNFGTFNT